VQEKRIHPRVHVELDVIYAVKGGGAEVSGHASDVSMGGMFIQSDHSPAFGTELSIRARIGGTEVVLPAIVRWTRSGGFGVQFGLLGAKETHLIVGLFKS